MFSTCHAFSTLTLTKASVAMQNMKFAARLFAPSQSLPVSWTMVSLLFKLEKMHFQNHVKRLVKNLQHQFNSYHFCFSFKIELCVYLNAFSLVPWRWHTKELGPGGEQNGDKQKKKGHEWFFFFFFFLGGSPLLMSRSKQDNWNTFCMVTFFFGGGGGGLEPRSHPPPPLPIGTPLLLGMFQVLLRTKISSLCVCLLYDKKSYARIGYATRIAHNIYLFVCRAAIYSENDNGGAGWFCLQNEGERVPLWRLDFPED